MTSRLGSDRKRKRIHNDGVVLMIEQTPGNLLTRSRPFEALFIDFYGTIAAGDLEAVEAACERIVDELSVPITAREFAVRWGRRFFKIVENSNHESFQTLSRCVLVSLEDSLREFAGDVDGTRFLDGLEAYWRAPALHDDVLGLFAAIDLPVCCVSNADSKHLGEALELHGLRLDCVVASEDVRCYKPDPGIFQYALKVMGVDPSRTLHVGDSLHSDVGGAARLGIKTAWLCRKVRTHDIGTAKPDFTITKLTELVPLLSE